MVFYHSLYSHHKEGGWYTFSRYVGYYKADMVAVYLEKVVEIATHFLCSIHGCVYLDIRVGQQDMVYRRERAVLYICRNVQVGFHGGYPALAFYYSIGTKVSDKVDKRIRKHTAGNKKIIIAF